MACTRPAPVIMLNQFRKNLHCEHLEEIFFSRFFTGGGRGRVIATRRHPPGRIMHHLLTRPSLSRLSGQRSRLLAGILLSSSSATSSLAGFIDQQRFERAKQLAVTKKWSGTLPVEEFLRHAGVLPSADGAERKRVPILDVRAPCEYLQGHLPGAISVPLFTDEERAEVGTLYKKAGHDSAVERGLEIVTAKGWDKLLSAAPELSEGDDVLVYCFRGGMRSGSVAHLLSTAPLNVHTLEGGYKKFRHWAMDAWEECDRPITSVGGPTGSGKTDVLHALRDELGAQVLDLEGEANHRGSIFGALGRPAQPSNEHYENVLALQWRGFEAHRTVFIEDESHNVGKCGVPRGLWGRMRAPEAQVLRIGVPHEARVAKLVQEYGAYDPSLIADCVRGLHKKLGNAKVAELCELLEERQPPGLAEVADFLLAGYYDDMYAYQAKKRKDEMDGAPQVVVECPSGDALDNARLLVEKAKEGGREV